MKYDIMKTEIRLGFCCLFAFCALNFHVISDQEGKRFTCTLRLRSGRSIFLQLFLANKEKVNAGKKLYDKIGKSEEITMILLKSKCCSYGILNGYIDKRQKKYYNY